MALLVHVELVHCYWMTAIEVNHLVGLTMNSGATGPWPGLMTSGPGRSAESAHCRRSWSYWLSMSRKVWCTYLFLSAAGTELQPLQHLVSFISGEHLHWCFKAECWGLVLDNGGSARRGRWLRVVTYRRWLSWPCYHRCFL